MICWIHIFETLNDCKSISLKIRILFGALAALYEVGVFLGSDW